MRLDVAQRELDARHAQRRTAAGRQQRERVVGKELVRPAAGVARRAQRDGRVARGARAVGRDRQRLRVADAFGVEQRGERAGGARARKDAQLGLRELEAEVGRQRRGKRQRQLRTRVSGGEPKRCVLCAASRTWRKQRVRLKRCASAAAHVAFAAHAPLGSAASVKLSVATWSSAATAAAAAHSASAASHIRCASVCVALVVGLLFVDAFRPLGETTVLANDNE